MSRRLRINKIILEFLYFIIVNNLYAGLLCIFHARRAELSPMYFATKRLRYTTPMAPNLVTLASVQCLCYVMHRPQLVFLNHCPQGRPFYSAAVNLLGRTRFVPTYQSAMEAKLA